MYNEPRLMERRGIEVWIFGIPHSRDSTASKDRFPLFPISRNNALCAFIQEIPSSNLGIVKWGLSFIVRFLPACAGKVPRFGCVLFLLASFAVHYSLDHYKTRRREF
jgi:hypothetical protein